MTYKFPARWKTEECDWKDWKEEGRIDCRLRSCCFTCIHANIKTDIDLVYGDENIAQKVVRIQCEHECVCEKYRNAEDREIVSEIMLERVSEDE